MDVGFRWLMVGAVLALMAVAVRAEEGPSAGDALRMSILLNGAWESCPMTEPGQIPSEGWKPTRVPALPLTEAGRPAGMWYRKLLDVPAEWLRNGRRVVMRLEKVGHYAAVYCNGTRVTEHYDQFTPVEADLSEYLKGGEVNHITVLVHDASGAFARPGGALADEKAGFAYRPAGQGPTQRNWVGIVGDVSLCWRPDEGVEEVLITTSFRQKTIQADVEMAGELTNGYTCRAVVLDGEKVVLELPEGPVQGASVRLSSPWQNFVPWNPPQLGEPKLYWLRVEVLRDGKVVDRSFTRFGFREVWAEGNRLMINGQRLFINGTYHAWLDALTYNNDRRAIAQDLAAMQAAGINALHGHWDDLGRATLDLCDEMGVMVVNAFYCDGQLAIKPDADAAWPAWALEIAGRWAKATRGHPSVVAWRPFCALPRNLEKLTDMPKWRQQVSEAIRRQAPAAVIVDGGDIVAYCQGAVKADGQPEPSTRMAEWARNSRVPLLTNEIWASFTPFEPHAAFLKDYYRQAWESGSAGFIVQHIPYCRSDPAFRVQWLSESGAGGRGDDWAMKRRVNWCDASRSAWTADEYGMLMRELTTQITGKSPEPFAGRTNGDVLIRGVAADTPVFLLPVEAAMAEPLGLLPAGDGTAWAVVPKPGRYRVVQGQRSQDTRVEAQLTVPPPGYGAVQRVELGQGSGAKLQETRR